MLTPKKQFSIIQHSQVGDLESDYEQNFLQSKRNLLMYFVIQQAVINIGKLINVFVHSFYDLTVFKVYTGIILFQIAFELGITLFQRQKMTFKQIENFMVFSYMVLYLQNYFHVNIQGIKNLSGLTISQSLLLNYYIIFAHTMVFAVSMRDFKKFAKVQLFPKILFYVLINAQVILIPSKRFVHSNIYILAAILELVFNKMNGQKDFRNFEQIWKLNNFNKNFQELYSRHLPIPVVFVKKDEEGSQLKYFNENLYFANIFKNAEFSEDRFENFQIIDERNFINNTLNNNQNDTPKTLNQIVKNLSLANNQEFIDIRIDVRLSSSQQTQSLVKSDMYLDIRNYKQRFFKIIIKKIFWDQEEVLIILMTETTSKINLDQLKELDIYKDQILASISHELKTPLNASTVFLNQARKLTQNQTIQDYLTISIKTQQLLNLVISDVIDYSMIRSQKFFVKPSIFQLQQLVSQVFGLFEFQAKQKGINLCLENRETQVQIINDEHRIKQVLVNFIANALKFTNKGEIRVILQPNTLNSNYLEILVSDTGIGIQQNQIPNLGRIFGSAFNQQKMEEFKQNEESEENNFSEGVGLGLMFCKTIINKLGPAQELGVASIVGQGTTFKFLIFKSIDLEENPRRFRYSSLNKKNRNSVSNESEFGENYIEQMKQSKPDILIPVSRNLKENSIQMNQSPRPPIPLGSQSSIHNLKIEQDQIQKLAENPLPKIKTLIVDDNIFNIQAIQTLLSENSQLYEIFCSFSGDEAITLCKQVEFDLIFMDINMPGMDGIMTTNQIRKLFKQGVLVKNPFISFVSAYENLLNEEMCSAGDFYISKPINEDKLQTVLTKYQSKQQTKVPLVSM